MTEAELREKKVAVMREWIGRKQADGSHKPIIDLYNKTTPLPRGYKVKYTDSWCATTDSAASIKAGLKDIMPIECSCQKMIELAKDMGIWIESDAYVPDPGDSILYDWDDDGKGDCTGSPEHIGVVETVSGDIIKVIEGNKGKAVGRRDIKINGRYIRGFIAPRYESLATKKPAASTSTSATTSKTSKSLSAIAKEVIDGKWSCGAERRRRLSIAGYDPDAVQKEVNRILKEKAKKPISEIAQEVIAGKWGNGAERKKKLEAAGYDYDQVQAAVNKLKK